MGTYAKFSCHMCGCNVLHVCSYARAAPQSHFQLINNTLELVCRTCLKNCDLNFDIFSHRRNNILVADMLGNCTSLEIQKENGFPISICNNCMEKLTSAFDFKTMVIESNTKLHQLHRSEGIKKEEELCNIDVEDILINEENFIKIEQPIVTDLCFKKEDSQENQTNKEETHVEVEFKSFKENADFLIESRTSFSTKDLSAIDKCKEIKQTNLHCRCDDALEIQTNKEEIDCIKAQFKFESLDENAGFLVDSMGTSSNLKDPLDGRGEKFRRNSSAIKVRRKRKNFKNYDERNAESLDNPDYKRIVNSDMTWEEKYRESVFCAECNKTFSFCYYIANHAYTHTGKVPYKCDKCEKRYPKEYLLRRHMRSHLQMRNFSCDVCGKCFTRESILQTHKALKHSEERPYKCNFCKLTFKISSAWARHSMNHMKDKQYVCEVCGKAFAQMARLNDHKEIHATEKNFVCTKCDKAFTYKRALTSHVKMHLNEKTCVCSYCAKRFHNMTLLEQHFLTHTGGKPYTR